MTWITSSKEKFDLRFIRNFKICTNLFTRNVTKKLNILTNQAGCGPYSVQLYRRILKVYVWLYGCMVTVVLCGGEREEPFKIERRTMSNFLNCLLILLSKSDVNLFFKRLFNSPQPPLISSRSQMGWLFFLSFDATPFAIKLP